MISDVTDLDFCLLPRRLIPARPVDVALCKLHLHDVNVMMQGKHKPGAYHIPTEIVLLFLLEAA
jgi:hypothetical protein